MVNLPSISIKGDSLGSLGDDADDGDAHRAIRPTHKDPLVGLICEVPVTGLPVVRYLLHSYRYK